MWKMHKVRECVKSQVLLLQVFWFAHQSVHDIEYRQRTVSHKLSDTRSKVFRCKSSIYILDIYERDRVIQWVRCSCHHSKQSTWSRSRFQLAILTIYCSTYELWTVQKMSFSHFVSKDVILPYPTWENIPSNTRFRNSYGVMEPRDMKFKQGTSPSQLSTSDVAYIFILDIEQLNTRSTNRLMLKPNP
jgi:hypothetical protein